MRDKFSFFREEVREINGVTALPKYLQHYTDVQAVYETVNSIYTTELDDYHLQAREVVTDVTPGFKPFTVGMTLACLMHDRDVEYIETERDNDGNAIIDTAKVLNIDVHFYLQR